MLAKLKEALKEFLPHRTLEQILLGASMGWIFGQSAGYDTFTCVSVSIFFALGGSIHDVYGFMKNKGVLPTLKELSSLIFKTKDENDK